MTSPNFAGTRVGLVGCVKSKRSVPTPAADLYNSALFRGRRAFVERSCQTWYVLSAEHGLVEPDRVLAPYDKTLSGASRDEKRQWSDWVLIQIDDLGFGVASTTFEIHAGAEYRDFGLVNGLERRGATVEVPTAHLSQGQQLAFYAGSVPRPRSQPSRRPRPATPQRSSYTPLSEYLATIEAAEARVSFTSLERILGRPLPDSARKHRACWANDSAGTHSHARAWMGVGWHVGFVDLNAGVVHFRKARP